MSGSEAELYFIQYQHKGALNRLQSGSTDTIMMRMAAVQGRASCSGAPETERSFSVKKNNAGSVTVNGHCVPIDPMCNSGALKYEAASSGRTYTPSCMCLQECSLGCPASLPKQKLCCRLFLFKSSITKLLSEKISASQAGNRCHWVWDTDENSVCVGA